MLKTYKATRFVCIDNDELYQVGDCEYIMDDDATVLSEKVVINNLSFDECYAFLQDNIYHYIQPTTSRILKRPLIKVKYGWDYTEKYKYFDTITYKVVFEECKLSLAYIMKNFPADLCIQYLKERGMGMCSIDTTK